MVDCSDVRAALRPGHCATKDIGNKLTQHIGNSTPRVTLGLGGGRGGQGRAMRIQKTQRNRSEGNQPTILGFRNTNHFSYKGLAHKDEFPPPLYLPVRPDSSHLRQRWVLHIPKPFGIWHGRWQVQTGWRHLSQGFMWALCVINREEAIAPFLLSLGSSCRWFHGFLLEGTVHPFMPPVLLRMSWFDALRHNPHLDPPRGQRRQSSSAYRGKGRAIVSADSLRQAVLPKNTLKYRTHMSIVRLGENLAAKKHTGTSVADSQRIAANSVTGANPTLEIGAPDTIGPVGTQEWLGPYARA